MRMNFLLALYNLVPASKLLIKTCAEVTADNVLRSLHEQGLNFYLCRLFVNDWDIESSEMEDDDFLQAIQIEQAGHCGDLFIITEACTRYNKKNFICNAKYLKEFVHNYNYDMFFDGDVIIVAPASKTITIYHHEGYYLHIVL